MLTIFTRSLTCNISHTFPSQVSTGHCFPYISFTCQYKAMFPIHFLHMSVQGNVPIHFLHMSVQNRAMFPIHVSTGQCFPYISFTCQYRAMFPYISFTCQYRTGQCFPYISFTCQYSVMFPIHVSTGNVSRSHAFQYRAMFLIHFLHISQNLY